VVLTAGTCNKLEYLKFIPVDFFTTRSDNTGGAMLLTILKVSIAMVLIRRTCSDGKFAF